MKLEHAKALVEAGGTMGIEIRLREEYSGRGMYGRSVAAITCDKHSDLIGAVAVAAIDVEDQESFAEDMGSLSFDSMGMGLVAY